MHWLINATKQFNRQVNHPKTTCQFCVFFRLAPYFHRVSLLFRKIVALPNQIRKYAYVKSRNTQAIKTGLPELLECRPEGLLLGFGCSIYHYLFCCFNSKTIIYDMLSIWYLIMFPITGVRN